jgi:hypothetical protein
VDPLGRRQHVQCLHAPYADVFRNVELEMVLNGWAWVLERYEPDPRYPAALEEARRRKRGIWALEGNVPPWEFKRTKALAARRKESMKASELDEVCPRPGCGGSLMKRAGRFGAFLGCSNFPTCSFSRSLAPQ